MNSPESGLDNFVNMTAKSTIAVVIPLFGYWDDIQGNPVNGEVLSAVMKRVYSSVHNLLIIFVANPETLPNSPDDPESVVNILASYNAGGNVKSLPVARTASYAEYVRTGIKYALEDTQAQFVTVLNPWVMIQDGGIDALVDRTNRADDAKVVSGFNVRSAIQPETFDQFTTPIPNESWDTNMDFLAMPRYAAEMVNFDPAYLTKVFMELDIFQSMRSKGFSVITSERIPIFTFDFPWKAYQPKDMFEQDRAHFMEKWGFDPGITYE